MTKPAVNFMEIMMIPARPDDDALENRLQKLKTTESLLKNEVQSLMECDTQYPIKPFNIPLADGDMGMLKLADVMDAKSIQSMMDDFFKLTNIGVGIIDIHGKVLVGTGWQDICTQFHRAHPETCQNCIESDTRLSNGVKPGAFRLYRCKNNMWDIATPINVDGQCVGSLFLGQFLFSDESPDMDVFRTQAQKYGFNEKEYLAALERVPRWDRETVNTVMSFYTKLAHLISEISFNNIKLTRTLMERDSFLKSLLESEQNLNITLNSIGDAVMASDRNGLVVRMNPVAERLTGWRATDAMGKPLETVFRIVQENTRKTVESPVKKVLRAGTIVGLANHTLLISKEGKDIPIADSGAPIKNDAGNVTGVVLVFRDQTEERAAQKALEDSQERFRALHNASFGGISIHDRGIIQDCNQGLSDMTGFAHDELVGMNGLELIAPKWREQVLRNIMNGVEQSYDIEGLRRDGATYHLRIQGKNIPYHGKSVQVTEFRDITEHKQTEEALSFLLTCGLQVSGEDFFASLARYLSETLSMEYVCIDRLEGDGLTAQTVAIYNRGKFETNVTYTLKDTPCGEVVNKHVCCYPSGVRQWFPRDAALQELMAESYFGTALLDSKGQPIGLIAVIGQQALPNSRQAESLLRLVAPRAAGELERRRSEEEKAKLQARLNQAQKMESIGRLAGGVAHDFNNILQTILGYTEMAMEDARPGSPLLESLTEIRNAANRSADLTRQLLAFARKQTIAPRVLDLNETVEGMLKMLRRLIGENIDIAWLAGTHLWPIRIDPSQINQIMANLCVNARDAIENVGNVTIETKNISFNESYCAVHIGFVPGDYVLLEVSDNGIGMDKQTVANIFEPFFTTKEMGKGTGLGLATVYGIVKQNNGFINVYSEPDHGTTFKIYLPRHVLGDADVPVENPEKPLEGGSETILLVEDETTILHMGQSMLEKLGYRVLTTSTPEEAILMAKKHAGEIHLFITDVIMPGMNGGDLANHLLTLDPNLKRLFMSGYPANVIDRHGVLEEGVHFIQKPFAMKDIACKVRSVLDENLG